MDQTLISLEITPLEIVQKPSSLTYQPEEAAPRVVVFEVNLEVPG